MTTVTGTEFVLDLSAVNRHSLPIAGGKGANLGELIAAGAPVPPGYIITTAAYAGVAGAAAIESAIAAADFPTLREQLREVPIPDPLRTEILSAYRRLGGGAVAVRSSGTAEDLPGAAFAGQHDTFLNVVGEAALLDAVRNCWASLWSDRVVEYRRDIGVDAAEVTIAVVVQKMVQSQAAGVMFTANPVSGDRGQAVIDASPGLGESVVSGLVTPDHYVVNKKKLKTVEATLGRREVVIRSLEGGGTHTSSEKASNDPVLSAAQIRRLVGLGESIQEHFGTPQDTEWSLVDDEFHLVQARPITAMPSPLPSIDFKQRVGIKMASEMLPMRPYPLDVTAWITDSFKGVQAFTSSMGLGFPDPDTFLRQQDGVVTELLPPRPVVGPRTPFILLRSAMRAQKYSREAMLADPLLEDFLTRVSQGLDRDLSTVDYADLSPLLDDALTLFSQIMRMRTRFLARCVFATARFRLSLALLRRGELTTALLAGVDTKTAETNRDLEALAETIRTDPALAAIFAHQQSADIERVLRSDPAGRHFADRFDAFLTEHGHRESVMLMVSQATWRDAPEQVLGILKGMAAAPAPEKNLSGRTRTESELFGHPLARLRPVRAMLRRQLAAARGFTQFREDTHYYATMAMPVVRRILMEYGARLVAMGAIDQVDDVFHLHRGELNLTGSGTATTSDITRIRELVERRKRLREELADKPLVDPRYLNAGGKVAGALVSGSPGSAGRVSAPVRVISGVADFDRLQAGEVLVAPYTNPSWTPLFSRAAAVVVDTGAAMSHAAIVAREYGIPAVLGAAGATTLLHDGMMVTVDGASGAVTAAGATPPTV